MNYRETKNPTWIVFTLLVAFVISLRPRINLESLTPRLIKEHFLGILKNQRPIECTPLEL